MPPRLRARRQNGSPPFNRQTNLPARARSTRSWLVSPGGRRPAPPRPPLQIFSASEPGKAQQFLVHQKVIDNAVRALKNLLALEGQKSRVTGPRANEIDFSGIHFQALSIRYSTIDPRCSIAGAPIYQMASRIPCAPCRSSSSATKDPNFSESATGPFIWARTNRFPSRLATTPCKLNSPFSATACAAIGT